jgi:hypothetical protein
LKAQPSPPEFWHFGDTDPNGFHILQDLRERSEIHFRAFLMSCRPSPRTFPLSEKERMLTHSLLARMEAERPALEAILAAGAKGNFEQESLKPPTLATWPFYEGALPPNPESR